MTLALMGGNAQYTVLVADRRLTADGLPLDEESPKALLFQSPRARLAVSFSGLATAPGFQMRFALPEVLKDAAKEADLPAGVVGAVAARLTEAFSRLPAIVDDVAKRTVVLFCGYEYNEAGEAEIFIRSTTNYVSGAEATQDFFVDEIEDASRFNYIYAAGAWPAIPAHQREALGALLDAAKPALAVVGKAVEVLREAAAAELADGVIGGQVMSLVVPAARSSAPVGEYHTAVPTDTIFLPDVVSVDAHGEGIAIMSPSMTSGALTPEEVKEHYRRGRLGLPIDRPQQFPPVAFPKVGRNQPCACGSGKKYKHCHGR